ncbi:MAG: penicillin acylase family protein [Sandaracinaceae bacterium]
MQRIWSTLVALSILSSCAFAGDPIIDGEDSMAVRRTPLRVLRDERGVPHIDAGSLEEAMYALGWVHAEDRLFQMHYRRLRMQGRLAEHFYRADDASAEALNAKLVAHDRMARTLGFARRARRTAGALPTEYQALLRAYARGVNDQVAARPSLGTAFIEAGIDTFEPWEAADSLLAWEAIGEVFGSTIAAAQHEVDMMSQCAGPGGCPALGCNATVIDEEAAIVPPPEDGAWPPSYEDRMASYLPAAAVRPPVDVKASQGFVVAGDRMRDGRPFLFGEPQIALEAPSVWYEAHVSVQPANIDVRGVGFAGAPGFLLFWNRYVAQTITAGGGDLADLFELATTEDGRSYVVDGSEEAFASRTETILVRDGAPITFEVLESRYGPVVSDVLDGAGSQTLALRHASSLRPGDHSVVAGIELMRAHTLEAYRDALRHWVAPTVNALYAGVDEDDGEGHIAYHATFVIPRRAPQVIGDRDVTGQHPYDGSRSANDWRGQLDLDWNPHVIDPPSGYLFSGNHLPVGTWYDAFVYSGVRGNGDTFRSFELRTRLARMVATPGGADPAALHALHVDARSIALERIIVAMQQLRDDGVLPADEPGTVPTTAAATASRVLSGLERWLDEGGVMDQRVVGHPLAEAMLGRIITASRVDAFACEWGAAEGGVTHFLREYATDPSALQRPEAGVLITAAGAAWATVMGEGHLGPDVSTWTARVEPDVISYQRDFSCVVEATGACSLTEAHEREAIVPQNTVATIASSFASSWPFTVDFSNVDAAYALLSPGVSEEPRSARFDDQIPAIEHKGRGDIDALPPSPLSLSRVTVVEETALTYSP